MSQTPDKPTSLTGEHAWLEDGFMTTPEVATLLRVDEQTVRQWCRGALIRYVKEPISKKYLICETDVRVVAKRCDGRKAHVAIVRALRLKEGGVWEA
jgi:hypothetical protein